MKTAEKAKSLLEALRGGPPYFDLALERDQDIGRKPPQLTTKVRVSKSGNKVKRSAMELGVCYYPEHWTEDTWIPDAKRMKEIGLSWVRVGEFAWKRLEPTSGKFNFDWLDRAIDNLGNAGLKVMLGTPTATPPKWLVDKYDDVFQVDKHGRIRGFGSRRHYCYNSKSYRKETTRIVTLLTTRYSKHEAVQAWQTDNEYGCHDTVRCYCDNCKRDFRIWLKEKYKTVEALNEAWWNRFWSMEYNAFHEIELPNLTVTEPNPSHTLDFFRFSSDSVISYNKLQTEILRTYSDKPITHNAMILFGHYDHFKLAKDLDAITWDNYPLGMLELGLTSPSEVSPGAVSTDALFSDEIKNRFMRSGHPDLISFNHDLYYGVKDKPFWVIEQQPGQVNWAPSNPLPAPGAVRLWTHQAFAHGADVVAYFRWRAANGAQETMHAGLNLFDGSPDVATHEAKQVVKELTPLTGGLSEEQVGLVRSKVALLFDYENLWATSIQPHAQGWNYWALQLTYYMAMRGLGLDVAITHPRSDLSPYKVVLAPALNMVDESLAQHLTAYVKQGGQLVIGPRSGFKTFTSRVHTPAPGPLSELMGVTINKVDALRPGYTEHVELVFNKGLKPLNYTTWADLLTPITANVLAKYESDAYKNVAAVTEQKHGKGYCLTIGMWTDVAGLRVLLEPILKRAKIETVKLPEGVRRTQRGDKAYLLNFNAKDVNVKSKGFPTTISKHDVLMKKLA
ncbi:MAG: beta-galactosidase [Trueperaceae bacterium]